ncbi:MAG: hypothetical protein ACRENL_00530 [Candidatus Dormibacteria bacterium]
MVVAGAAAIVLSTLRTPLLALLVEVCVGHHRARFWWRVSAAELVAGTALCATTSLALTGLKAAPGLTAVAVLRGGLAGLLVSLVAITAGTVAVGQAGGVASKPDAR